MNLFLPLIQVLILLGRPWNALASLGNSFPNYKSCVETCRDDICDKAGYYFVKHDVISLPVLMLWKCSDDCQYRCMWGVVELFQKKGWPPPQFHGKWPFVRFMGIQEPASALFSFMNFSCHGKMFYNYVKTYRRDSPMFKIWVVYAVLSMNGWVWSTIFHTRDTPFTELMDYLSAFAIVFCGIYAIGMRLLVGARTRYSTFYTALCFFLFVNHAVYLSSGPFDYGYNLFANVSVGFMSAGICGYFLAKHWGLPQCKKLALAVLIVLCSTYFEVNDFPPILWVLDAHALWHFTTFPAIYLFWNFVMEDSKYLLKKPFHKCDDAVEEHKLLTSDG